MHRPKSVHCVFRAAAVALLTAASPALGAEPALDVETLVGEVLERNPSLEARRAALDAAQEREPQAMAFDDPRFAASFAPGTIGRSELDFGLRFELSQALPWPGLRSARAAAARSEAAFRGTDVETTGLYLVAATREAFAQWWFVHRAKERNEANRELMRELGRIAESRYGAGLAAKQDALQAELEVQRTLHRALVLERSAREVAARINRLRHRPPRAALPPPVAALPTRPAPPSMDELEEGLLRRHPALRGHRERIAARRSRVEVARLAAFPTLVLNAGYNSLWDAEGKRAQIGAGISLPIQQEPRRAAGSEARAQLRRAEALEREAIDQLRYEIARHADELSEQRAIIELHERAIVPVAEERLDAARSGYDSGANDFATLVEAETALLSVELARDRAKAEAQAAWARLNAATGGALEKELSR